MEGSPIRGSGERFYVMLRTRSLSAGYHLPHSLDSLIKCQILLRFLRRLCFRYACWLIVNPPIKPEYLFTGADSVDSGEHFTL